MPRSTNVGRTDLNLFDDIDLLAGFGGDMVTGARWERRDESRKVAHISEKSANGSWIAQNKAQKTDGKRMQRAADKRGAQVGIVPGGSRGVVMVRILVRSRNRGWG